MSQSKRFTFTLNNYTKDQQEFLSSVECQFMIIGEEVAASGTPHLQGYVVFKSTQRLTGAIKKLPGCHVEIAKGSTPQNITYCSKEGKFVEYGDRPLTAKEKGTKEKERYKHAVAAAKVGDFDEIPHDLYTRFYGTYQRMAKDYMTKPDSLPGTCGYWIHGPPGSGKSHVVVTTYPDRYIKPINKWWDGYQNEDVVHIDELDPSHATWIAPYLKKWADKYAFDAEIKGGALQLRPAKIIVTSNYSIMEMGFDAITTVALQRRFREIVKTREQDIII